MDRTLREYEQFEDWFHEVENFATRSERFHEEVEHILSYRYKNSIKVEQLMIWLRAAFEAGNKIEKTI